MFHVSFTGTRHGMTVRQKHTFYGLVIHWDVVPEAVTFHHGSCMGADVEAANIANSHADFIHAHPGPDGDMCRELSGVDDHTEEGKTHFARNRDMVNLCQLLIACPCDHTEQKRGGTWYTVDYARKHDKRVKIIWPNGKITEIEPDGNTILHP